jgi:uncharacterized protein involved in exopolysaccharide biosynthesis
LIDSGAQVSQDQQLATLSIETAQARAKVIDTQTRAQTLAALKSKGALDSAPEVLSSLPIQQMQESLVRALASPGAFGSQTGALRAEIAAQSNRIVQGLQIEAQTAQARERLLNIELRSLRDEITQRRKAEFRLDALRRQLTANKLAVEDAQKRLNDLLNRTDGGRPDVEIIGETQVSKRPVSPNPIKMALICFLLATLAGIATIWRTFSAALARLLLAPSTDFHQEMK